MQWQLAVVAIGVMIMSMSGIDGQIKSNNAVFYVAPDGNDTWSGKAASPDQQEANGPFATLSRALDAIHDLKQEQNGLLKQPVTIYLRGGTYFLDEPLTLMPDNSGTEDCPITIEAYPDEKPTISGGRLIKNWKRVDDNLWVAYLPEVKTGKQYFRLLRVGENWAVRARYPNFEPQNPRTGGWLFAQPWGDGDSREYIGMTADNFPDWQDWDGAEVHIFPAWGWVNAILKVDDVDRERFALKVQCQQDIRPGNRFFIANTREALNSPDEWYLDVKSGELLYWTTDPSFPEVETVATAMDKLIVLQGNVDERRFVEHIRFCGLTFADTDYTVPGGYYSPADAAIWLLAARQCVIKNCTFVNSGGYAIRMEQRSHENEIIGNTMKKLGQGGVIMLGETAFGRSRSLHHSAVSAQNVLS